MEPSSTEPASTDERISLAGIDPVEALRSLLKVDPDSEPVGNEASSRSLLEIAEQQLAKAEAAFQRDPTDKADQAVGRARTLVLSEREREQKPRGPVRPPTPS